MTADGPQVVRSLRALLDALQRVAPPAEFPADRFPDAVASLLAYRRGEIRTGAGPEYADDGSWNRPRGGRLIATGGCREVQTRTRAEVTGLGDAVPLRHSPTPAVVGRPALALRRSTFQRQPNLQEIRPNATG
jgi:hypothetical protein